MKLIIFTILLLFSLLGKAQSTLSGTVIDSENNPIIGANVYLEGTYDGGTTDDKGNFRFQTDRTGIQTLKVSFLSFDSYFVSDTVSSLNDLHIELREDVNSLDAVVLSAGTFSAGDNSKISVLKPLDIVTTASALGDYVGALQTLPGTSTVAEDGRLFVRGGEAEETQIFIDGIRVFTPYTPSTSNTPTRGRYSPFLFEGITFSTGAYSAEFGQALSSVLLLNTVDQPSQEKTDIGIMTVGATLGHTEIWKQQSLSLNASYINLSPYNNLFPDRNKYLKPFEGFSGETVFRQKFDNGLFKFYAAFDHSNLEVIQESINHPYGFRYKLNNNNLYLNSSYQGMINNTLTVFGGLSYTLANSKIGFDNTAVNDLEKSLHTKLSFRQHFNNRFKLNFGVEYFDTNFDEDVTLETEEPKKHYGFNDRIFAAYAESDIFFSKKFALKLGLRSAYTELLHHWSLQPRLSLAYKTSEKGQISLAYGNFLQNPSKNILKFSQDLIPERTRHYILNYQYNNQGRIFRAEAFYKDYKDLVNYDNEFPQYTDEFSNKGYGFASGLDFFWRDSKSVKNLDYWMSYSYLNTKRKYKHYPTEAQPNFVNDHNLSLVGKYFITKLRSQVGLSYNFASGRTYTDPNKTGFLNQKTKTYNNISLNWAYLISQQKILYFSVNNVLGFENINGYQYRYQPNEAGIYESQALRPAADQFFFVGFFWTISENGNDNQLDKL